GVVFTQISAGGGATCAVTSKRDLYCWGIIATATSPITAPLLMPGGVQVQSVSVGTFGVCLLNLSGSAYCLGLNTSGQLGTGDSTSATTPRAVNTGLKFKTVSSGLNSTCALTSGGAAWCWGSNGQRTLGTTSSANSPVPVAVEGGKSFVSLVDGA